jgi:putative DNA primase/helicase
MDQTSALTAALAYAQRGWRVFPVHVPLYGGCSCRNPACKNIGKHPCTSHGLNDATTDPDTIQAWWNRWPRANVAIRTGAPSGIVVLDVDPGHGGDGSLADLEREHGKLPPTLTSLTGGGGQHSIFDHPGFSVKTSTNIKPGLDVRADGGYIVAPPSKHESGRNYRWQISKGGVLFAKLPDWLLSLANAVKDKARKAAGTWKINEGCRNDALTSVGGSLRNLGMDEHAIAAALLVHNISFCNPPLPEDEVRRIARSVARYAAAPNKTKKDGLIKELADAITSAHDFARDQGGWLYRFADGFYKRDGESQIKRLVKGLLQDRGKSKKWSSRLAGEVMEYIRVDATELWERPRLDVVNLANGLLDVETGEIRPHSAKFLSPIQLPVAYDPSAVCPEWEKFASEIFEDDCQELAWEIPAWFMTPNISIQKAVLLVGEGANGKSTFLAAVRAFIGRTNVAAESLHRLESNRFAVAQLVGKLANICPDIPSARLADSAMFKALTGGDYITAEYKYMAPFAVLPYARLLFSANHLPCSRDASHAFFRRWTIVPLYRSIDASKQIPRGKLDALLAAPSELSGVLNKAIPALRKIQARGDLLESESIRKAGLEFRRVTDPLARWLGAITVKDRKAMVAKDALLKAYNDAAELEDRPPITSTALGLAVHRLMPEIEDAQRTIDGKKQWVWTGLGLRGRVN